MILITLMMLFYYATEPVEVDYGIVPPPVYVQYRPVKLEMPIMVGEIILEEIDDE